jgi:hypothetical protein
LKDLYKATSKWDLVNTLVMVAPNTEETIRMVTLIGNLDNLPFQKLSGFKEHVLAMHYRMAKAGEKRHTVAYAKVVKDDMVFSTAFSSAQISQWWQLSKREGEYWELLEKILNGEYEPGQAINNKAPGSIAHFISLSGLQEAFVLDLLRQAVNNEISLRNMDLMAKTHKCMNKVRRETVKHLMTIGALEFDIDSKCPVKEQNEQYDEAFATVLDKCPVFALGWQEGWSGTAKRFKINERLPEPFYADVDKKWLAAKRTLTTNELLDNNKVHTQMSLSNPS